MVITNIIVSKIAKQCCIFEFEFELIDLSLPVEKFPYPRKRSCGVYNRDDFYVFVVADEFVWDMDRLQLSRRETHLHI